MFAFARLRLFALFAALATVHSSPAVVPSESAPSKSRPNVVVVVIDDMGMEDLETLAPKTLMALASRGRFFANFFVCPTCSPSRAALQFGRYSVRDGVHGVLNPHSLEEHGVPPQRISIAEALGERGYATACFGKWHVSTRADTLLRESAREHGYDRWLAGNPGNLGREGDDTHFEWHRIDDGVMLPSYEYSSSAVTAAFEAWWSASPDAPRFAVVNYFTPHEPFTPPPAELLPAGHVVGKSTRDRYESSVLALDHLLGDLVAAIDFSNTYLFVFSDNGTPHQVPPPTRRSRGYKLSAWQGGVNVPLIVVGPRVERGISEHLAHAVDVPRTVLELCGAAPESGFEDSVSFAPALVGDAPPRAPIYVHNTFNFDPGIYAQDCWAVIDAKLMKLVSHDGEEKLFDVARDPGERSSIVDADASARLRAVRDAIVVGLR
jgi:arylsulfatase